MSTTALTEGWIASAGLDDTEEEPAKMENWTPEANPLFGLTTLEQFIRAWHRSNELSRRLE